MYHDRKFKKCKYCDKEAKRMMVGTRNKGHMRTCGSDECKRKQYHDPKVSADKAHHRENHPKWKGGIRIQNGYRQVRINGRYRYEHRVIAERVLGRKLKSTECVHHINEDRLDNRNCNLLICTMGYHRSLHERMKKRALQVGGSGTLFQRE